MLASSNKLPSPRETTLDHLKSAGQCIQSGACFGLISSVKEKEDSNPVPSKQVSMPSAGPTSFCSGTSVPRALQQFSASLAALSTFSSLDLILLLFV